MTPWQHLFRAVSPGSWAATVRLRQMLLEVLVALSLAFLEDLTDSGDGRRVVILVFPAFGRRHDTCYPCGRE